MTIWKAALKVIDTQDIEVPEGSEILCAREQFDGICIWFRCFPNNPMEKRTISIVGTGHPTNGFGRYLGTAALAGGELMFHVFEQPRLTA